MVPATKNRWFIPHHHCREGGILRRASDSIECAPRVFCTGSKPLPFRMLMFSQRLGSGINGDRQISGPPSDDHRASKMHTLYLRPPLSPRIKFRPKDVQRNQSSASDPAPFIQRWIVSETASTLTHVYCVHGPPFRCLNEFVAVDLTLELDSLDPFDFRGIDQTVHVTIPRAHCIFSPPCIYYTNTLFLGF